MSVEDELRQIFSNPHAETHEGVIAAGGRLQPDLLIYAYDHGIFPWPHEGYPLLWFCPDERGVIDFADLHLAKSFQKWLRKNHTLYTITMNQKFHAVLLGCMKQKRQGQAGTWITSEIERSYLELHRQGHAYSLEVMRDERLVAGIYGVQSARYYSCESMFHLEDNTSKLALLELVVHLRNAGQTWIDIQMVTDVCKSFGGKMIGKEDFLKRLGR